MKQVIKAQITEKASDGSFTAVASSQKEDRHGEVVDQKGWDLKSFKKNPVLLWAHDHTIPAIGVAKRVWLSEGRLMFKGIFHDATDFSKGIKQMVEDGILNSFSVGFLPSEMDGNTYTKQELLEISLVNVPANSDAQMLAFKSLKKAGIADKTMEDLGINVELVDKFVSMEDSINKLTKQVESLVKVQPTAPQVTKTRQSLVKVIARATDKSLSDQKKSNDHNKNLIIIKRAVEILSKSYKEQING